MMFKTMAGVAAIVVAITMAAPAHADNASYLAYLRSHGQDILAYGPVENDWLTAGHFACSRLRDGATPDEAANLPLYKLQENGPLVVEAARHELCPDKL
jgi:hypothetical protein